MPVMNMKTNKEILCSILKTTQMGQVGIRSVQDQAEKAELKQALASQLREYDQIENEARELARQRGWQLKELNQGVVTMSEMMSRAMLTGGNRDSKIAGMMIQGNTRGVIKGLKNAHRHGHPDCKVSTLAEKLLSTEDRNIAEMRPFL